MKAHIKFIFILCLLLLPLVTSEASSLVKDPLVLVDKYQGLEKYFFDNIFGVVEGDNVRIEIDVNVNRWTWLLDAVDNPTLAKCQTAEPYIKEDYPNFDCNKASHRNLLLEKLTTFRDQGLRLKVRGEQRGFISKQGDKINITIPLTTLQNKDLIEIGENSIHYVYYGENVRAVDENGFTITELRLTTDDHTYLNGKPHVNKGFGDDLLGHVFYITSYTPEAITELRTIDLHTGQEVERNVKLKYLEYYEETLEVCVNASNYVCYEYENKTFDRTVWKDVSLINDTNGYALGIFSDIKNKDYLDYDFKFYGISVADSPVNWASISGDFSNDLIHHWSFEDGDGGTSAEDRTGNADGVKLTNVPVSVTGKIEDAYYFENFESINYSNTLTNVDITTSPLSINFWLNLSESADYGNHITSGLVSGGGWALVTRENDAMQVTKPGFIIDGCVTQDNVVDKLSWAMVTMVAYGNGTNEIWVNGSMECTGTLTQTYSAGGSIGHMGGVDRRLNATQDELSIWNRSLSGAEIQTLWNNGDGIPYEDNVGPTVDLNSPANDTTVNSNGYSALFNYTATDSANSIDNCTLYVWNVSDNSLKYTQTNTTVINGSSSTFSQVLMASNYSWNVYCIDNESALGFNATNFTINVIPIPDLAPTVTLNSPDNDSEYITAPADVDFNCTASDDVNLSNVSLVVNGAVQETNTSGINNSDYLFSLSSLADGSYTWSCLAIDNQSQSTQPTARDFTVDTNAPSVSITSPANGTNITQVEEQIQLNWTAIDENIDTCWWSVNNYSLRYRDGIELEATVLATGGWIYVTDNTTQQWDVDITVPASTGGNIKIYKTPNSTTGDFQQIDGPVDGQVNMDLYGNGWHYFTISLSQFAGNKASIDIFRVYQTNDYAYHEANIIGCDINTTTFNFPPDNPNNLTLIVLANDAVGRIGTDNVTVLKSTTAPVISVTDPLTNYARLIDGQTLNLNFTTTNTTVLDSCYYEYNGANVSLVTCDGQNTTFSYVAGQNTLTVYVNDTLGNLGSNVTTWTFDLIENSQTFPSSTTEGSTETFSANVTLGTGVIVQSVEFYYDGTSYVGEVFASGSDYIARITGFIIPNVDEVVNKTFYFNLTLSTGSNAILTSNNVTVSPISIDNCSVFTNNILFFRHVKELEQTVIENSSIEYKVNIFTEDGSIELLNISENTTSNPLEICLGFNFTNTTNFLLDTLVKYQGTDGNTSYVIEYYNIDGLALNNDTDLQNITLYNLDSGNSTEFKVTFTGADFVAVEGALVYVKRQYIAENVFKTVELPKTDSNGQTLVHLVRNDQLYTFVVVVGGEVVGTFNNIIAFCDDFTIGDCQIQLNGQDTGEEIYNSSEALGIIYSAPTYDNTTRLVSFDFVTSDGTAKTVIMNVTRNDVFGNRSVCQSSVLSSGGTLSCEVPSTVTDTDLRTVIYVNDVQTVTDTVRLTEVAYGVFGYFILFVYLISLGLMFSRSKSLLIIGLIIGMLSGIGFGLIEGKAIGAGAIGISLVVAGVVMLWKLNKERVQ